MNASDPSKKSRVGLPHWLNPLNMAWFGTFALVVSLSWSEAIQNIAVGIILAAILWNLWQVPRSEWIADRLRWRHGLLFIALFGLSVLAGLYTEDVAIWLKDLRQKLPFLLFGLIFGILPRFSYRQLYVIFLAFLLIQAVLAVWSLVLFFQYYEMGMGRIARNAHIDIVGKISHIYFGILMAGSVIVGLGMWLRKMIVKYPWERYVVLFLTLLNFVCIHLLSSRTGLVALYGGLGLGAVVYVIRTRAWRTGIVLLLLLLAIPGISYYTIPTFRTRIHATIWDIQGYRNAERDLSHHSASLRLIAWEAALDIFLKSPIVGVGMGDVETEMQERYQAMKIRANPDQLPNTPHNQYLEFMAGFGTLGMLCLGAICLYPWFAKRKKISFLFISFVGMYMTAMLFESLLERQIGMYFFLIFIQLLSSIPPAALFHKPFSQT